MWTLGFGFFNLAHVSKGHPCCSMNQYIIPLYGGIIFCCRDVPLFFLIHLLTDGLLKFFIDFILMPLYSASLLHSVVCLEDLSM